jgi:hypothetical protein
MTDTALTGVTLEDGARDAKPGGSLRDVLAALFEDRLAVLGGVLVLLTV